MFVPKKFEETNKVKITDHIEKYSFATLVTNSVKGIWATHIPLLFNPDEGENGVLEGHIARANIQHKNFTEQEEILAIFQGPHHYISPSWYIKNDVPTWNYTTIHAYGKISIIEDKDYLLNHLKRMVQKYESDFETGWSIESLSEDYINTLSKPIIGFKIDISRIEAKSKLGQNRSVEDMEGYINALENIGTENSLGIAELAKIKLKEKLIKNGMHRYVL